MPKKKQGPKRGHGEAGPHDPMQEATPTPVRRAGNGKKPTRERDGADRAQCTAHKRNGDRCNNPPVRGTSVCRMHGGSAPQVKAKANQRLVDMIMPAMRELRRVIDSKTASDADKLKAVNMILNRTGYNERQTIELGLREPTPFDRLQSEGFTVLRGRENVIDPADEHPTLGMGGGDDVDHYNRETRRSINRATEEADTYLDGMDDADVVTGRVVEERQRPAADPFHREERERAEFARRRTEHDPEPVSRPADPWQAYEKRVREGVEER